jgi:hypothetical protein
MEIFSATCVEKFKNLDSLNNYIKENLQSLLDIQAPPDIRHRVLLTSLCRLVEYFDAYLFLAKRGYAEPSSVILRSCYEGYLWMRYSVISEENAQYYIDGSAEQIVSMGKKLIRQKLMQLNDTTNGNIIDSQIINNVKANEPPSWQKMANTTGLGDLHALIYPYLSSLSHGSIIFKRKRIVSDGILYPYSDPRDIEPFTEIAIIIFKDAYEVCSKWIKLNELAPPTNISLIIQNAKNSFIKKN